jgi:hypothetical protein
LVAGDDAGATVGLDVPFPFYGVEYSQLNATTNGYLSTLLTDYGYDFTNDCSLPVWPSAGGGARIYAYHDDLIASVYYQYFDVAPIPNERNQYSGASVFQWVGYRYGGTGTVDVEAFLYDNGDISFFVKSSGGEYGVNATFGIQNETATEGMTLSCNVSQGADEFAFSICSNIETVPLASWATFSVFFLIFAFVLFRKRHLF